MCTYIQFICMYLEQSVTNFALQKCFLLKIPKYAANDLQLATFLPAEIGVTGKYASVVWSDSRSVA